MSEYRILLVDDEPAILDTLEKVIKKDSRFEIVGEAFSAKQARIKIENLKLDVIFTDIKMPGETGIDLLKTIADSSIEVLSVVLSGYDNFDYVHDAFIYGAEEYLLKPVEPAKVLKLLDKIALKLDNRKQIELLKLDDSLIRDINDMNDMDIFKGVNVKDIAIGSKGVNDTEIINGINHNNENHKNGNYSENYLTNAEKIINEIDKYLKINLDCDNGIVVICKKFAISQPYLSKIFKKTKNMTYNEYLISLKVSSAKALLRERKDLLIADIAEQTGFADQFYFSRVFKNITGKTPSEFRNL